TPSVGESSTWGPVLAWGRVFFSHSLCYAICVYFITVSYKLKLFPTANKANTLGLLTALYARLHTECTTVLREGRRCPSTKDRGESVGRAYRRAFTDWRRARKAGPQQGELTAELEALRCWRCEFTHHVDLNASRVIAKPARRVSCASH